MQAKQRMLAIKMSGILLLKGMRLKEMFFFISIKTIKTKQGTVNYLWVLVKTKTSFSRYADAL